jgi:uncharacterized protein YgbK (DUF1537 family)
VLFDVLYQEQLQRIGELIDAFATSGSPLFSVGSSAVEEASGAHWAAQGRLTPVENWSEPGPKGPLLVVSGSCSPVTWRQIETGLSKGFAEVSLNSGKNPAADASETVEQTVRNLKAGRGAIVHTSRGETDFQVDAATGRFGEALGQITRAIVSRSGVKRLLVAGGDTSGQVAQALGIEALEMVAPISPGAPLCRAYARNQPTDGLEVVFKGGQMGSEDLFTAVAKGRIQF